MALAQIGFEASHTPVWLALLTVAFGALFYTIFVPPKRLYANPNGIAIVQSRFGGLGAVGFYDNRYSFLNRVVTKDNRKPHQGIAKFNLFGKIVYHVGSNDEQVMRAIMTNKDLSFSQGNQFLFAGIQGAGQKGINVEGEMDAQEKREMRDLAKAITPQRLNAMAPRLAQDAFEAIEVSVKAQADGSSSAVDLHKTYYPLVFRFTVRIMGMAEYASRPEQLQRLFDAFWHTQRNSGFFTTILPWLPQPRLLKRLYGAATLWLMVRQTLKERIASGQRYDDYAQDMIDVGHAPGTISRFVIGGLIAGILNTIGTGAYSVAFVGADEALQTECRQALDNGLRRACGDEYDDLTPLERLQRIRLEQWESYEEFNILHLVFKESIRLMLTNSLNRYYPGPSRNKDGSLRPRLHIDGHAIEDDVYICFSPPSNLHDADAYQRPLEFDPHRYDVKGEGGDSDYTFIAWGAGYHRCTGQRFAKLETIIALAAYLLFTKRLETVDDQGKPYSLATIPLPDLSQRHWRAPSKPMRVKLIR